MSAESGLPDSCYGDLPGCTWGSGEDGISKHSPEECGARVCMCGAGAGPVAVTEHDPDCPMRGVNDTALSPERAGARHHSPEECGAAAWANTQKFWSGVLRQMEMSVAGSPAEPNAREKEQMDARDEQLVRVAQALGVPPLPEGDTTVSAYLELVTQTGQHYSWLSLVEAHLALIRKHLDLISKHSNMIEKYGVGS